jgi:uncharacterized protein YraI
MKHAALGAVLLALTAACATAQAQVQVVAFTAKTVNLRAGPAREYPVVVVLPPNFQVTVQGCLADASWCDVVAGYDRGWVYAGNIAYPYENQWQPLVTLAPVIGIAVLPFVFDDYWHQHYWNRPWYPERYRWERVPPPRFARPHPPGRAPDGWRAPPNWQPGQPGWNPGVPRRSGEHPRGPGQVQPPHVVPPAQPRQNAAPRAPAPPAVMPAPRAQPQQQQPHPQQQRPQPRGGEQRERGEHDRRG